MTRVLQVIGTLDANGCERQMAALTTRLSRDRFEPHVCAITRGGPLEAPLAAAGVPVTILGKRWKLDFSVVGRLRDLIVQGRFDIVHTWMFTAGAFGRRAAFQAGAPVAIASEQNADVWKPWLYRHIDRRYAARTWRIVVNSEDVRDFYAREVGIPAEKIVVIENGLEMERLEPKDPGGLRRELGIGPGRLIGTAGRLAPQKAVGDLIAAFALLAPRFPDLRCVVAGEGDERRALERQIAAAGLGDRCRLVGYVDRIADFFSMLDLFVLSSLFEGSPNVLQQAMALGRPVVATDVAGTRLTVKDGQTGLLVPAGRPDRLAAAIAALLADGEQRGLLALRGRADVLDRFTMTTMVQRYQTLYEDAVASPRPS